MAQNYDFEKVDRLSTEVMTTLTKLFSKNNLTIREALLVIVGGLGKLLQVVSYAAEIERERIFTTVAEGILTYFKKGGDDRIDMAIRLTNESLKEDKENFN